MNVIHDNNELFLFGRIKALEQDILGIADFSRLAENKDSRSFISELGEGKFRKFLENKSLSRAISDYIYDEFAELSKKLDNKRILEPLMLENDIFNLIAFLRSSPPDNYKKGLYKEAWFEEEKWPPFFSEIKWRIIKDPRWRNIEEAPVLLIGKTAYDLLYKDYISEIKNTEILHYWKEKIDIKNLLLNIRYSRHYQLSEIYYLKGGYISDAYWYHVKVSEKIPEKLRTKPYLKYSAKEERYEKWDFLLQSYLAGMIKKMRKKCFGLSHVFAYMMTLIMESSNINKVSVAIDMRLEKENILRGLNLTYV